MGALWRGWRDVLARIGFETAALDAKILTAHALSVDFLALSIRENELVDTLLTSRVAALIQRRMSGESVARIVGEKEFYGLAFGLNGATLEPRPDTELLVDLAIKDLPGGGRFLDLGTGTGCIPIAILANRPDATALASDLNPDALAMAQRNGERHGVLWRLDFAQGDWFAALGTREERFDLIVSNPPYIASAVIETLSPEVRSFDPWLALDGGADGIAPYRIIAAESGRFLKPGGQVLVEIGFDQGEAVAALFAAHGFDQIRVHRDLNGLDRVIQAHQIGAANTVS
ncbi:peptide chain release factor N(5)-glutamine methyltransferase [Devosia faecipullorum]|uniref:peptide chain release factor N(5)-glutamine methyltransferase n=1 Tax=Devosia faecipullorum TaxID=2755039 RepID=UPI002ED8518B